jgi:hypothetical protein
MGNILGLGGRWSMVACSSSFVFFIFFHLLLGFIHCSSLI